MAKKLYTKIEVEKLKKIKELALDGLSEKLHRIDEYINNIFEYIHKSQNEGRKIRKFRNDIISRVGYITVAFAEFEDPEVKKMVRLEDNFPYFCDGKRGHLLDNTKDSYKILIKQIEEIDKDLFYEIKNAQKELGK